MSGFPASVGTLFPFPGFTWQLPPFANAVTSVSGVVNREKPQSKQTKTLGKRKMPGLSKPATPEKWNTISVENSASFLDVHKTQDIRSTSMLWRSSHFRFNRTYTNDGHRVECLSVQNCTPQKNVLRFEG